MYELYIRTDKIKTNKLSAWVYLTTQITASSSSSFTIRNIRIVSSTLTNVRNVHSVNLCHLFSICKILLIFQQQKKSKIKLTPCNLFVYTHLQMKSNNNIWLSTKWCVCVCELLCVVFMQFINDDGVLVEIFPVGILHAKYYMYTHVLMFNEEEKLLYTFSYKFTFIATICVTQIGVDYRAFWSFCSLFFTLVIFSGCTNSMNEKEGNYFFPKSNKK